MVVAAIMGDILIILKISSGSTFLLFAFFRAGSLLKKTVKLAQRPLQDRAVNTLLNLLEELESFVIFSFESSLN